MSVSDQEFNSMRDWFILQAQMDAFAKDGEPKQYVPHNKRVWIQGTAPKSSIPKHTELIEDAQEETP